MFYAILLGIDASAAAVILFFFLTGLADGTVSSVNAGLWAVVLAAMAAVIGGGLVLRGKGNRHLANIVLALLAVPAVLFVLFFLTLIVSNPRWN